MSEPETPEHENLAERLLAPSAPARRYEAPPDLWIVTSLFNPAGFVTKARNFDRFAATLERSRIPLLVVACSMGEAVPGVSERHGVKVLRVSDADTMWQKERLINLGISALPPEATKVAWLDADVLFSNQRWALETSRLLDMVPIVQPFDRAVRLQRGSLTHANRGEAWDGFAYVYATDSSRHSSSTYRVHGHTGFGWAARRDFLQRHGLYDRAVSGSGDHYMAHAFAGQLDLRCLDHMGQRLRADFTRWGSKVAAHVDGNLGYVAGDVLHLWHGESHRRSYVHRHDDFRELVFDPATDLAAGRDGAWRWTGSKPALEQSAAAYFAARLEDG